MAQWFSTLAAMSMLHARICLQVPPKGITYGPSYPWLLTFEPTLGRVLDPELIAKPGDFRVKDRKQEQVG